MTVRIEAGKIEEGCTNYQRVIKVTDDTWSSPIFEQTVYAVTGEELEIIDHENFRKE